MGKIFDSFFAIRSFFIKGPKTLYDFLYQTVNLGRILEKPFFNLTQKLKELPIKYIFIFKVIHLIFNSLPKILPAMIFLIEIVYLERLDLFYKALFFVVIPLIYNMLLWILGDLSDKNTYFVTAHVYITDYENDDYTMRFREEIPLIEGAVDIVSRKYDQALLDWFFYVYETYVDIKWLVYRLSLEKEKYQFWEKLIVSLLYLSGWLFILYKIYSF